MNAHQLLSEDGYALLALCSAFALPNDSAGGEAAPFTLSEWNQLARRIETSAIKRPATLAKYSADQLGKELGMPKEDAERITRLLERRGRLALELESLLSRGMWAVTRIDPAYPSKLRDTLKHQAPAVLFGAGDLTSRPGVAVVGSRDIDPAGTAFAQLAGRQIVAAGSTVISGGARGTDRIAMEAGLETAGTAVGVLADSLERTVRQPDVRQFLLEGRLLLLTPYLPSAGFSVGAAMGRNKIIYGLAGYAIVVSSDFQRGGTWAGAVEALKARWCPIFVWAGDTAPQGNRELLKLGAVPISDRDLDTSTPLPNWLRNHASSSAELDLFSTPVLNDAGSRKNKGQ